MDLSGLARGAERPDVAYQADLHAGQRAADRDESALLIGRFDPMKELDHGRLGGPVEIHELHLPAEPTAPTLYEGRMQRFARGQYGSQRRQTSNAWGCAHERVQQRGPAVHELDARIAQPLEKSFRLQAERVAGAAAVLRGYDGLIKAGFPNETGD